MMKMSELVKKSDTPKSTILYYIKEGLLPEPQKPKPNQHLYDESSVDMIAFIQYLQKHFGCSINQIKAVVHHEDFDFDKGFESLLNTLHIVMGAAQQETYSATQLCEHFGIDAATLQRYVDEGVLFKRDGYFTGKELEILGILCEGEANGIDPHIIRHYIEHARALAELEIRFGRSILEKSDDTERALKSFFDTTLILKPYIFNMHTLKIYQSQKELS